MALEKFNLWQTFRNEAIIMPAGNKPLAFMGAEVKIQASMLRINISDYPQYSALESPTKASAKTLPAIATLWRVTGARLRPAVRLCRLRDST